MDKWEEKENRCFFFFPKEWIAGGVSMPLPFRKTNSVWRFTL